MSMKYNCNTGELVYHTKLGLGIVQSKMATGLWEVSFIGKAPNVFVYKDALKQISTLSIRDDYHKLLENLKRKFEGAY